MIRKLNEGGQSTCKKDDIVLAFLSSMKHLSPFFVCGNVKPESCIILRRVLLINFNAVFRLAWFLCVTEWKCKFMKDL